MDTQTIFAYEAMTAEIAALHKTLVPVDIYRLINKHFKRKSKCLDIGCGIGRDTKWLADHGYDVIGIDASISMLKHAKACYPGIHFYQDSLPLLSSQRNAAFDNLLCSAVIMHLPQTQIIKAMKNILRICRSNGIIIISFRNTNSPNYRENEKLYTPLDVGVIERQFITLGATLLCSETSHEESRDLYWSNLVFKKSQHLAV